MPEFNIESINYTIAGNRQEILNIDISSPHGYQANKTFFTDNELGTYSGDIFKSFGYVGGLNKNEHGFVFLDSPKNYFARALYDAKDVALKSAIAKRLANPTEKDLLSTNTGNSNADDFDIDMYFPHLRKDPLGFIQLDPYSYGITDKIVVAPVLRETNVKEQSENQSFQESFQFRPKWNFSLNPYDAFGSTSHDPSTKENLIPIYIYTPRANLKSIVLNVLSSESNAELSSIDERAESIISSYYSFRQFMNEKTNTEVLSNLFKPVYNFTNVEHNYIVETPLNKSSGSDARVDTGDNPYYLGIVKSDMIMAKNAYDNIYDTNISSVSNFSRIREYTGINRVGRKIFLTYFDDVDYNPENEKTFRDVKDYNYENSVSAISEVKEWKSSYRKDRDYMKIECIDAINRFISLSKHKTNVYTTNIDGLDDCLPEDKYSPDKKEKIKEDIKNTISRIVKNFAPAHTQYFPAIKVGKNTNHC